MAERVVPSETESEFSVEDEEEYDNQVLQHALDILGNDDNNSDLGSETSEPNVEIKDVDLNQDPVPSPWSWESSYDDRWAIVNHLISFHASLLHSRQNLILALVKEHRKALVNARLRASAPFLKVLK